MWWDLKREKMNWKVREGDSNPIIPYPIVQYLWYVLMIFMASEESPAMLARGTPMNPARGANEGWARTPPTPHKAGSRPAKPATVVGYYVNVEVEDHLPC